MNPGLSMFKFLIYANNSFNSLFRFVSFTFFSAMATSSRSLGMLTLSKRIRLINTRRLLFGRVLFLTKLMKFSLFLANISAVSRFLDCVF